MKYTLKLNPGIAEVLQLDDSLMCKALGVEVIKWRKTFIQVEADRQGFLNLLDDCKHRQDGGWDQPTWYTNSARAAEEKVRALLAVIPQ